MTRPLYLADSFDFRREMSRYELRTGSAVGIEGTDIDWNEQLVRVIRQGSRDEQWLPISTKSMIWLACV